MSRSTSAIPTRFPARSISRARATTSTTPTFLRPPFPRAIARGGPAGDPPDTNNNLRPGGQVFDRR